MFIIASSFTTSSIITSSIIIFSFITSSIIIFSFITSSKINNLNNKDVITESSIEEEDQEEIFGFIGDVSENKESHNDNSTTNN